MEIPGGALVGSSVSLSELRNIALSSRFSSEPCPSVEESEKLTKKGRFSPMVVQDSVLIPKKVLVAAEIVKSSERRADRG